MRNSPGCRWILIEDVMTYKNRTDRAREGGRNSGPDSDATTG